MAQNLGEASWKAFTKKQKLELDDGALVKALARFDKTDIAKPAPRVEALDDVVEQAKKQVVALARKKKELGDKAFNEAKDKLHEVIEDAERLLKESRAALESAEDGDDEDEADAPVLLTTKMIPLVRELRKGDKTMHAMIGLAGKSTAVLIMRRPISPSRRKLVGEAIDAKGGAKYILGECRFEDNALTFVVKTQAAGLAKRLKAALLEQTEMRLKVRVRGEDPNDVDEEDEQDEDDVGKGQAQAAPPGGPATAEQLAYTQRLNKVKARLDAALAAQHPESTKLRAVSGFASEKAAAGDYPGATKALQMLEKLLDGAGGEGQGGVDAGVAIKARMAALVPTVKQAQEAGGAAAQEAKLRVSQAAVSATKRDFAQANALLDQAEALLEAGGAGPSGAAATPAAQGQAAAVRAAQDAVAARLAGKPAFDSLTQDLSGARDALVAARDALDDAFATADAQVRRLQAFLAVHPDQELRAIAGSSEFGINALTAGYRVKLTGAVRVLVGASPSDLPRALTRARQLVAEFRFHVQSSDRIEACDENPVGVPVGIRGSLGPALRQTAAAVEGFAA